MWRLTTRELHARRETMARYNYDCIYQCGDEECDKCYWHGIIFECPGDCKEYKSQYNPEALKDEE